MSDLGPEAKKLLDEHRDGDDPPAGEQERLQAILLARIAEGSGPLLPSLAQSGSEAAASAAAGGSLAPWTKIAGGLLVASLGVGLARTLAGPTPDAPPQAPAPTAPSAVAPRSSSPPLPSALASAEPGGSAAPVAPPPPAASASSASAARPKARSGEPTASAPAKTPGVEDEVRLLSEAQRALNGGDPEKALAILDEHQKAHPDGALSEEREAGQLLALCKSGKASTVSPRATRFLREHPSSPLAPLVRKSCLDPAEPAPPLP